MRRFPYLAVIIAALLIAAVFLFLERMPEEPSGRDERGGSGRPARPKAVGKPAGTVSEAKSSRTGQVTRSIAIIIDDIGYDLAIVGELAQIPAPIAFAVLPHTPHAAEAAGRLHAAGKEILLHLPMEPRSYPAENPGAGALMADMDEGEIRRTLRRDLAAVPFASGVNNHMGSRFMEDGSRLAVVMEELRGLNLFFVDSMTTADSRGRESARRADVRFAARDLFIDHAPGYAAALNSLKGTADQHQNGAPVLMIGHPHAETLRALRGALPYWQTRGVRVVSLSAFLPAPEVTEGQLGNDPQAAGAGR